jgi:hypothetical protein
MRKIIKENPDSRRKFFTSLSYNDAQRWYYDGRCSAQDYRWYCLFWEWSVVRLSSTWQDRVYARLGKEFYHRRIARVSQLRERFIAQIS